MDAQIEELLLSKLLGTGKSRGSPPCNELRDPCFPSRDENLPSHGAVPASLCPTRYAIDVASHDCFNDVFNQDKKDTS